MTILEERVLRAAREIITQKSERDNQVLIGPSDMADPCNKCLASKLAGVKPHREFSMFPWLGTAMHKLIEWTADLVRFTHNPGVNDMAWEFFGPGKAHFEMKIFICHIEGYGDVYGSVDVYVIGEQIIIDWKSTSKKRIQQMKIKGVPENYIGQLTMYMRGLLEKGYPVETGMLVFIPRDAATPADIWAKEVPYVEANAQQIITRVNQLMQWVKAGRWHELASDSDCLTCHPRFFG